MTMAMQRFFEYKRQGLARRAQYLIENVDNVITCFNLDLGRDVSSFIHKVSTLFKLNLYEDEIGMSSNDPDITEVINVAKFLLQNKEQLQDELVRINKAKRHLNFATDSIIISSDDDDDDDELPDLSPSAVGPIRGFRAVQRLTPYNKTSTARTATVQNETSTTLSESDWQKRESELFTAHQNELSTLRQETRNELLECVICLSAEKDSTLVPCGHTFCKDCTARMTAKHQCFFCKAQVKSTVRMILTD